MEWKWKTSVWIVHRISPVQQIQYVFVGCIDHLSLGLIGGERERGSTFVFRIKGIFHGHFQAENTRSIGSCVTRKRKAIVLTVMLHMFLVLLSHGQVCIPNLVGTSAHVLVVRGSQFTRSLSYPTFTHPFSLSTPRFPDFPPPSLSNTTTPSAEDFRSDT